VQAGHGRPASANFQSAGSAHTQADTNTLLESFFLPWPMQSAEPVAFSAIS
jgi:hypothetical protein